MPPAVAIGGAALLGAGATAYGASKQAGAMKDASRTQAASADAATQAQRDAFETTYSGMQPYQQTGYNAAPLLNYLITGVTPTMSPQEQQDFARLSGMGMQNAPQLSQGGPGNALSGPINAITGSVQQAMNQPLSLQDQSRLAALQGKSDIINMINQGGAFQADPLYNWEQQQGEKAINRAFAQRGGYNSSGAINALSDFNQGLGAQATQRKIGNLMSLVNIGTGGATATGNAAMNQGNALAGIQQNLGANQAGLQVQQGQNQASLYSGLGALPLNAYNAYNQANMYQQPQNAFFSSPSSGYVSSPQGFQVDSSKYSIMGG